MLKKLAWFFGGLVALLAMLGGAGYYFIHQYITDEDPARWANDIAKIEARYEGAPPQNVTVFVGSSSIRFWDSLSTDMAPVPVVNHGFGGSKIADTAYYADRLITPFSPSAVVIFAGTNDINGVKGNSKPGDAVASATIALFEKIHATHPDVPILYIPISPTESRWSVWPEAVRSNQIIEEHARGRPLITYVDVTDQLMAEGRPDPTLFRSDRLHLNEKGYAVWTAAVRPALIAALAAAGG